MNEALCGHTIRGCRDDGFHCVREVNRKITSVCGNTCCKPGTCFQKEMRRIHRRVLAAPFKTRIAVTEPPQAGNRRRSNGEGAATGWNKPLLRLITQYQQLRANVACDTVEPGYASVRKGIA